MYRTGGDYSVREYYLRGRKRRFRGEAKGNDDIPGGWNRFWGILFLYGPLGLRT